MSTYYYFYKEKDDYKAFNEGGYAGIPYLEDYDLESYNHKCDNCDKRDSKSEIVCYGCYSICKERYKITRDKISEIVKNMKYNKNLFENLMNEVGQDYIWMYEDY